MRKAERHERPKGTKGRKARRPKGTKGRKERRAAFPPWRREFLPCCFSASLPCVFSPQPFPRGAADRVGRLGAAGQPLVFTARLGRSSELREDPRVIEADVVGLGPPRERMRKGEPRGVELTLRGEQRRGRGERVGTFRLQRQRAPHFG